MCVWCMTLGLFELRTQEDGTVRVGDQLLEVQGENVKGIDFDEVREEGGGEAARRRFGRFFLHWPIDFFSRPIYSRSGG